ncbi:DNA polymerase III subunit epsilon [Chromatium okenii]|uniref:DNA polymerase III subunit epsilon n=1 Tax=Chromatium okenii TaxID=61644 RepID=UPI001906AA17|nr:DNA polymerase III subunit epsilon [Chromatium okenii]MBK1642794.1 DNA polymerase III subunit epsilon [Chromatium okenii]
MRQIVLDTETTGLSAEEGHRLIEIGCVELVDRRLTGNRFHQYLQPEREIDAEATKVHGITRAFLADKPRFAEIAAEFLAYIGDAELIIHNAPFDVGFLNHELRRWQPGLPTIAERGAVCDTLVLARQRHPGQRNSLDALCKRYQIDNAQRTLHGALLDAEILAEVYLAMTGGQVTLHLGGATADGSAATMAATAPRQFDANRPPLPVIRADAASTAAHEARLAAIAAATGGNCLWLQ